MGTDQTGTSAPSWRIELPVLTSRLVTLREPVVQDQAVLVDLLSIGDACRFGLEGRVTDNAVRELIDRAQQARAAGIAFTYAITIGGGRSVVGLVQVRQLDPGFEAAEWEVMLAPSARGSGVFLEAAGLVGSFAFTTVGAHRLEARVLLQNGRANGALRKLGAVQEGILRRSVRLRGEYFDQVLWSVLKDDWAQHLAPVTPRVH